MTTLPTFCARDCGGDACPLLVTIENGRVTRLVNNPAGGTFLKGCARGFGLHHSTYAPDRILQPLVRSGPRGSGQFRPVSWDEALDRVADRLQSTRERYGPQAVLNMASAGDTGALHGTPGLMGRFLGLFGGYTGMHTNYSNGAASFALPYVLGREHRIAGFDAATMQYAQMIILWGANILETRLGSELPQRLMEARKRGAQIVVIDPRRTPTVQHAATWHIACRPGTDAALMLAVLYVWITEDLLDRAFIAAHSVGFDRLEAYVLGRDGGEARSPQWAEPICGVPAGEVERFARAYARANPAMLIPGYSIQRVYAGEETFRLSVALQVASGNFGRKGGSTGAINSRLPVPRVGTLPQPDIPAQPAIPMVRWPDAVLQGRAGGYPADIHFLYVAGANYLNQGSDIRKNMAAFERAGFSVCHDMFLTPTARYCDVVLPAATALEKEDIGLPWAGNYLLYRPQIHPPLGEARSDYDIFCALADRLGFGEAFSQGRTAAQWIEAFIADSEITDVEAFRATGVYFAADQERTGLAAFRADPVGHPLSTPSGRVEIASEAYARDTGQPAIPTWQPAPADERWPLRLITPKTQHFTHSQGQNIPALRGKAPQALSMHPQDAAARGLHEGGRARVFNDRGVVLVPVTITEDILPGVVSLPEGAWVKLNARGEDEGGSANLLTDTRGTTAGTAAVMHAIPVQVSRA